MTEPKSEVEEVFSDSGSDGSDEVINLSSLSESETDDDTVQIRESLLDDSKDDETQQNYDLKVNIWFLVKLILLFVCLFSCEFFACISYLNEDPAVQLLEFK